MANLNAAFAPDLERAALSSDSVRAKVILFGGQIGAKKTTFLERHAAQDAELLHAQEELLRFKELVEIADREKEIALHELAEVKEALKHMQESVKKMANSNATTKDRFGSDVQMYGQGLDYLEDKHVVWEFKLTCANEKHTAALAEMESAKQQLADLKQELLATSSEKDNVVRQTEDALAAMEGSVKGAESFGTELAGVNNWLSLLKHSCFEFCSKEKDGAKKSSKCSLDEMHSGSHGFDMANELELKLLLMMNESIRVRQELKCANADEAKALLAASDVLVIIEATRAELEKKIQEGEISKKERTFNRASLLAVLETLKIQAETLQKEVLVLTEREAKAEAKSEALNAELIDVRAELLTAKSKANESISQLSLALKQAGADLAKHKTEVEALREEVSRTRSRAATVEAKSIVSVSQLSQALKQSEADLEEAKIEISTLLEEASNAAIHNAAAEAADMESMALRQAEAQLVEAKGVQTFQALKQAEAELQKMRADMQTLQGELSQARSHSAGEDAKAKECIAHLSQALRKAEAELESVKVNNEALQEDLSQARSRNAAEDAKAKECIAQISQALSKAKAELESVKVNNEALQEELSQARSSNAAEEAKARESLSQLSQALEEAEAELESVNMNNEALQEELSQARGHNAAEEAKARESLSQLSQALEGADGETALAKSEMKALREEVLRCRSKDAKQEANETMDSTAYVTHKRELQEARKPLTELDEALAMKASQMEVKQEVESLKMALKKALHRAEMAESGKLLAEHKLKRLREREHRRKEKAMAYITQQNLSKNPHNGNEQSSALAHCQPLGNVLNINISAERTKTLVRIGSHKLKEANFASFTGTQSSSKKT